MDGPTTEITPGAVYTLHETCQLLKISPSTARRWMKGGRLRSRKIGRDYRFLGRDLLDCLDGGLARSPAAQAPLPVGADHPLLALAGIGESGRSDIAEEHDRYLAALSKRDA